MTYTPPTVAPPAPLPWDPDALLDDVLAVLRLDEDDPDAQRVADAAVAATEMIDAELDYVSSPWITAEEIPEPINRAATNLAVELFRRKDAPFGRADSWSVDGASYILSADVMKGVRSILVKYRSRRGVA